MQTQTRRRNGGANQQVSTKDGMRGQGDLKVGVAALVASEIVQEQVQVGGDIGEAFATDSDRIEVHLEKTILMIERQENVVPILVLEEENTNEDVEPHVQIDGSDILNLFYNLLPHPSSQMERMGAIFFYQLFCYNTCFNFIP